MNIYVLHRTDVVGGQQKSNLKVVKLCRIYSTAPLKSHSGCTGRNCGAQHHIADVISECQNLCFCIPPFCATLDSITEDMNVSSS